MSIETWAAKKGIEVSATFLKNLAFVALVAGACYLAWSTATTVAPLRAENSALTEYKTTTQRKAEHSVAAEASHQEAKADEAQQDAQQAEVVVIHDRATKEAANEDPRTADFLGTRIPDRLRRADREARRARQDQE